MKTVQVNDEPAGISPHGIEIKKLYDNEHAQVVHMRLRPGEALKKHITPVDVFFYVLEGEGDVEIGDEIRRVGKDTLIESPAKIPHRLMNPTESDFRFLVVKVPKPTEKSVFVPVSQPS
jgi:mannose-6-phosphate isomerase-like protein (cupin superfamily)